MGTLGPSCGLDNLDLCSEEKKKLIETELEKLQSAYNDLQTANENTIAEVKASGQTLLKRVRTHKYGAAPPSSKGSSSSGSTLDWIIAEGTKLFEDTLSLLQGLYDTAM